MRIRRGWRFDESGTWTSDCEAERPPSPWPSPPGEGTWRFVSDRRMRRSTSVRVGHAEKSFPRSTKVVAHPLFGGEEWGEGGPELDSRSLLHTLRNCRHYLFSCRTTVLRVYQVFFDCFPGAGTQYLRELFLQACKRLPDYGRVPQFRKLLPKVAQVLIVAVIDCFAHFLFYQP